jgi:hypothetical protein
MSDLTKALLSLRPGAAWTLDGDQYEGITWLDEQQSKPTKEELTLEADRIQAEYDSKEYQRLRAPEYPPMADYLDAVYWQSKGDNTKMDAYLAAVEAVKSKYPKGNV